MHKQLHIVKFKKFILCYRLIIVKFLVYVSKQILIT